MRKISQLLRDLRFLKNNRFNFGRDKRKREIVEEYPEKKQKNESLWSRHKKKILGAGILLGTAGGLYLASKHTKKGRKLTDEFKGRYSTYHSTSLSNNENQQLNELKNKENLTKKEKLEKEKLENKKINLESAKHKHEGRKQSKEAAKEEKEEIREQSNELAKLYKDFENEKDPKEKKKYEELIKLHNQRDLAEKKIKEEKKENPYQLTFFGNKINKINEQIDALPPQKKKGLKRFLLRSLKSMGYEIYGGVKFTLKEVVRMAIQYVGPLVVASLLFKYRKQVGGYIRASPF